MKLGKKTLTVIAALAVLLSAAMMTSCANETPTEDPSSSATVNQTPGQTTAGPTQPQPTEPPVEDEDVVLNFGDGLVATAEVKKSREIELRAQSNYVLIKGTGKFTVKIGEAEPVASDDKFEVKLENTADVYNSMVMTIQVEAAQTLEFTLIHNPGTEGNPYEVAASGETKVDFKEGVFVKIVDSGWYTLTGNEFYLTNYTTKENPVNEYKAYLAAGVYGISVKDKNADSSVTLTRVAAPAGYSEGQPLDVTELGDAKLTLFSGTKLYFHFTAPAEGLYVFSTGSEGKGSNCRFSVSTDDYATYYGRYYENEQWLTCAGGKNYAVHMVEDGQITIVVDYTMGEKLVGSDEVSINISNPVKIEALDQAVSATLELKGKAYYAFTAEEKGLYSFNLGLGNVNKQSRFQVWRKVQSEGREDAVTYEWVKGEYYTGSAQARLEAGESVYIVVDSEKGAYGSVSVQVERSLEEPLPETGWVSGTYEGTVTIVLDRESKTVKYGNFDPVRFYYLDGKATFTVGTDSQKDTYTMTMNENGTDIDLTSLRSSGEEETVTFVYAVPVDPVAIEKWQGIYQDADGNKLSIFSDGSGMIGMNRYFVGSGSGTKYDSKKNILAWDGDYTITIESMNDSGRVASISVKPRGGDTVVYTLESETVVVPPQYLPVEDGQKYTGANKYTLIGLNNLNSADIVVLAKNDDGSYTISGLTSKDHDRIVMKVVIEKEGDEIVSIKLYDEEGTLLDTLAKPGKVETPDIKVDGTKQDQSKSDESFDGMYYVKITADGWYTFYGEEGVQIIAASENADGKMVTDWTNKYNLTISGVTTEYKAGDVIAFYNGNFTASYSTTKPESSEAGTENNPFQWDGSDLFMDDYRKNTDLFYITYKAPASGTYSFNFTKSGADNMQMYLIYNGKEYGRKYGDLGWDTYDSLPMVLELTQGQEITFAVSRGYKTFGGWTLSVKSNVQAGDTVDINQYIGTWSNGSSISLEIKGDGTVIYDGPFASGTFELQKESATRYVFWYENTMFGGMSPVYIDLKNGTILLTDWDEYTLKKGSGSEGGDVTPPVGEDLFTANQKGEYTYDDGNYYFSLTLTIHEDGSITYKDSFDSIADKVFPTKNYGAIQFVCDNGVVVNLYFNDDGTVRLTTSEGDDVNLTRVGGSAVENVTFTEGQQGEYAGVGEDYSTYTVTIKGDTIDFVWDLGFGAVYNFNDLKATLENGIYSVKYTLAGEENTLTFKFAGSDIVISMPNGENITLEKKMTTTDGVFTAGQVGSYIGNDGYGDHKLTIKEDGTVDYEYSYAWGWGETSETVTESYPNVTVAETANGYSISFEDEYGEEMIYYLSFNADGSIALVYDEYSEPVTLKKEVVAEDGFFTADQQGTYTGNIYGEQYTFTVKKDTIDIADDYGEGVDTAEDVVMTFDGEWYTAAVTVGYSEWDLKFKFVDGKIYFTTDDYEYYYLSKEGASSSDSLFEKEEEGTYIYEGAEGELYYLIINADGTVSFMDHLDNMVENATVELSVDMIWFQFNCGDIAIKFRFSNEAGTKITLDAGGAIVELTKDGAEDGEDETPDISFTEEQLGTYTGTQTDMGYNYTLTLKENGKVDFLWSLGWEDVSGKDLVPGYANGVYTITVYYYGDVIIDFTIGNGQVTLNLPSGENVYMNKAYFSNQSSFTENQQGSYTGRYEAAECDIVLKLNADGTVDFKYGYAEGWQEWKNLTVKANGETYFFDTVDSGEFSFSFQADGSVSLAFLGTPVTMTKQDGDAGDVEQGISFTEEQKGTYSGNIAGYGNYTLTINVDNTVTFTCTPAGYNQETGTPTLKNGEYTLVLYADWLEEVRFSFVDGQMTVTYADMFGTYPATAEKIA